MPASSKPTCSRHALATVLLAFALAASLSACLKEPPATSNERHAGLAAPLSPPLAADSTPRPGMRFSVQVGRVLDGDTFEFRHETQTYSVRMSGIDAPERTQPHADQARQALREMLVKQAVDIEVLKVDVYKRLVARVHVFSGGQWRDASLQMLDQGLAWHFRRYARDQSADERERYLHTEARARAQNRGLWQDGNPEPPWDFRDRQRGSRSR